MSRIRANTITNAAGTGAPTLPNGASIVGIVTASSANITDNVNIAGNVTAATFTGSSANLSGIVTAKSVIVGSAVTITSDGINTVGVITANDYDGNFILDSYLFN